MNKDYTVLQLIVVPVWLGVAGTLMTAVLERFVHSYAPRTILNYVISIFVGLVFGLTIRRFASVFRPFAGWVWVLPVTLVILEACSEWRYALWMFILTEREGLAAVGFYFYTLPAVACCVYSLVARAGTIGAPSSNR